MLKSIFELTTETISVGNFMIIFVTEVILGIVISLTHKLTTKTTSNFLITLALLPVLVEIVILLVNGNLGTSLAVAGAFSLIRFRSMPGNSKEIISVFWAMCIGLALGMGYVSLAIVATIIIAVLMFIYNVISNKVSDKEIRTLKVVIPENLNYETVFNDIFEKYLASYEIRKSKTTNMGSTFELSYMIKLKNNVKEKEFVDEIRVRNGNMLVMIERPEIEEEVL